MQRRVPAKAKNPGVPVRVFGSCLPWRWFAGCLLAPWFLLAALPARAADPPVPSAGASASAFDHLADQLEHDDVVLPTRADTMRALARHKADVPPGDVRRELRYRYLYCFLGIEGNPTAGKAYAERGLADAHRAGAVAAEINFHYCRGSYQEALTTPRDALPDYDAGIALAKRTENSQLVADGYTWRGSVQSLLGEYAKAVVNLLEAQRYYASTGSKGDQQGNLLNIAIAYRRLGEDTKARGYLDQLMAAGIQDKDVALQEAVHMELGFIGLQAGGGHLEDARQQFEAALDTAVNTQSTIGMASAHLGLAQVLNQTGAYGDALAMLATVKSELNRTGDHSSGDMVATQEGVAHAGLGKYPQAIADFDRAEALLRKSGNLRYYKDLLIQRSRSYEAIGNTGQALADLQHVVSLEAALESRARSDSATLMGYQFDAARRDQENQKLAADRKLQEQQLKSLERVRQWQQVALLLGGLLIVLLLWLAYRQVRFTRRLQQIANTDPLTGIANRRSIELQGQRMLEQAAINNLPMAVALIDIDHFKQVNDTYGHQVGDVVLARIAAVCRDTLRLGDVIGRIGGEEFLVLLPGVDVEQVRDIAERLRGMVEMLALDDVVPGQRVTISLGSTVRIEPDRHFGELVARADAALYRSKEAGRNRVTVAIEEDAAVKARRMPTPAAPH